MQYFTELKHKMFPLFNIVVHSEHIFILRIKTSFTLTLQLRLPRIQHFIVKLFAVLDVILSLRLCFPVHTHHFNQYLHLEIKKNSEN